MNKILTWTSGITFFLVVACFCLYQEALIPDWSLFFVPFVTGSIYAIWSDSFWKKISSDDRTDEHLQTLIRMIIRHKKDEGTLRVIMRKLSSEEMQGTLYRNYSWIVRDLIRRKGEDKGQLHATIRSICDLLREPAMKRFQVEVKTLVEGHALHATNTDFVRLFNDKTILCFLEAGGFPT